MIDNWAQGAVPVEKLCVSAPLTPSPSTPLPSVEEDVMMRSLSFDNSTGGEEMPVDISELRIHDDDGMEFHLPYSSTNFCRVSCRSFMQNLDF